MPGTVAAVVVSEPAVVLHEQLGIPQSPSAEWIGRRRRCGRRRRAFLAYLAFLLVGGRTKVGNRSSARLIASQVVTGPLELDIQRAAA
jgi:hypothetical protein